MKKYTYTFVSTNDLQLIVADDLQEALIDLYIKVEGDYKLIGVKKN